MNKEFFTQNMLKSCFATLVIGILSISGLVAQASFTGANFAIPTGAPTTSTGVASGTIAVTCVGVVPNGANITLMVHNTHTFTGDLSYWLVGPGGQVLELQTRLGGGNNNENVTFSDAGAVNITTQAVTASITTLACGTAGQTFAYNGTFRPEGRNNVIPAFPTSPSDVTAAGTFTFANTFSGLNADGTWTLHINDHVGGDVGATCTWTLNFANVVVAACTFVGGPVLPALNVSTGALNCVSAPIAVPATTGTCAGVVLSYSIDAGAFVVLAPGTTTVPGLSAGTHTITWRAVNSCNQTSNSTQTINVVDQVAPAITCPANINITLDPGACSAFIPYSVSFTDNCTSGTPVTFQVPPVILAHGGGAITYSDNNLPGGNMFNLTNTSTLSILISSIDVRFATNGIGIGGNVPSPTPVSVYQTIGNTYVGQTLNAAAWTPVALSVPVTVAGPNSDFSNVPLGAGLLLAPGATKGIFVIGNTHSLVYNSAANSTLVPFANGDLSVLSGIGIGGLFTGVTFGPPRTPNVRFNYIFTALTTLTQTAGLPSGSDFPIGTTTNCFRATDAAGNSSTCCFNVTVNEFPNPSSALACNDNVQVSLDSTCFAIVDASMILSGDVYGCYDNYIVEIQIGGNWIPPILGSQHVGQTIVTRVTDPATGNSCWGTITVEDKIPPVIECNDYTLICGQSLDPVFSPPLGGVNTCSQSPNLPVGPNAGTVTTSTCNVNLPAGAVIVDVDVYLDLSHTFIGDLSIVLVSPSGQITQLWENQCGGADNLDLTFDDEGLTVTGCPPVAGPTLHLQPVSFQLASPPLGQYDGQSPNGTWTLRVTDEVGLDGGILENWSVIINWIVNEPFAPIASDGCGEVDLTYTDTESGDPCEGLIITRHWTATDGSGNAAVCDQILTITPLDLDDVTCAVDFEGNCGESTDPSHTGWPTVNGNPITDENNVCNIFVGYWDKPLNDCGGGIKIIRTWSILDWCTHITLECVQVIKLSDDQAPVIECPSNITVGTDFWYCYANVSVPEPDVFDACGSAYTLSLSASGGHIVNFGNHYVINQLGIGTVTVTWTATDECGNSSSCTFTITVVDDVVPVANCDAHTVVALTNDGPNGVTLVPAHVFDDGSYDNCGPVTFRVRRMASCINFDWTNEGACVDDTPNGQVNSRDLGTVSRPCVPFACCDVGAEDPIMVELEVTDAAGNKNFCMVEAVVQDKISPFVECPPDITVSCDFWFNVEEGTFTDSPINHEGNGNGNLDEDPLSAIFGNMYDAFAYNDDESVREDIWINDPGNPDVSHPHFWGIDGWADDNCEVNLQVRVRVVNDCSGDDLPSGAPAGAVKMIERRFSASDGNQGIAPGTCTQRIWVVDFDPFFISDVTCGLYNNDDVVWPCDVLLNACPEQPTATGEPIVYDDACSLIGVAYEDQRFNFVDGACYKILRTWSVIDWCQYNSLTGYGLWQYTQVIKVHDNEGPVFLLCPNEPVTLCVADDGVSLPDNNQAFLGEDNPLSSSCSVHLNLCQPVRETCSDYVNYDVKLFLFNEDEFIYVKNLTSIEVDSNHIAALCFDTRENSSFQIRQNGIPYNSAFCGDYHRLLWSAEDGCGNWSHCEYLIRLEDCKQPSPVCINGLSTVVMPIGGQVTIWAKDFNASSFDDCTPAADLLYSFSGDNYQPSFTYTCDNVPSFGVELSVNIWVADGGTDDNCNGSIGWGERNKDFCTTTIVITDNGGACDTIGGSVLLAGEILTEDVQSVEKAAVTLTSPGHVFPTYVTVEDGKYSFFITPADYTVNVERNDAFKNGVSTLDLVRIQKHLLGIEAITSPFDLIAADANNSQTVSAIDLIELRKLILGIYTELPANKSWRFVHKFFQFADPTHPWPFTESINVNVATNHMNEDFVAIKIGDVNNTVQANALQVLPRNGKGVVNFVANDRIVNTGEMVDVAISSADFAAIEGYQFTLQTQGLEFRGVESGLVTMSDENLGVFGSTITASWHKVGGVSATASDVLFTLQFQATAPGKLSSMIALNSKETEAEAYNTLDDIKGLKLTFRGAEHGAEFALYQNEPNPFKGNTVIGYDLPEAGKVTLTLFDVTGKVLLTRPQDGVKGYNTISVSSKEMPSVGVLYYRLDANQYSATKKMVIIE